MSTFASALIASPVSSSRMSVMIASDGATQRIPTCMLNESAFVRILLDADNTEENEDTEKEEGEEEEDLEIRIPTASNAETLTDILYYCTLCKSEGALPIIISPMKTADMIAEAGPAFGEFVNKLKQTPLLRLRSIILVADFLEMESLLRLTSAALMSLIKEKSDAELSEMFDVPVMTEADEERILAENPWICE